MVIVMLVVVVMMAMVIVMMVMGRCARGESQNPLQGSVLQSSPAELGGLRCRGHSGLSLGAGPLGGRGAGQSCGRQPHLEAPQYCCAGPLAMGVGQSARGARRASSTSSSASKATVVLAPDLVSNACRARHASYPELV